MMARSLTSQAGTGISPNVPGGTRAVAGLVRCLLRFLRGEQQTTLKRTVSNPLPSSEAQRTDYSDKLISDEGPLAECLLWVVDLADDTKELADAESLICGSLGCILEASLHSESFFESFKNTSRFTALLRKALLHDQRRPIRFGTAMAISSICNHPS